MDRVGSAISLEGRGAQLLDLDSTVQNWGACPANQRDPWIIAATSLFAESGIEVTVVACTFFRNFAASFQTISALDVWPLVWTVDRSDFIHNEALAANSEIVYWTAPVTAEQAVLPAHVVCA